MADTQADGLPLLPKFKGTGLSVKEALEASLVAAGVEPDTASKLVKAAKPAKVKAAQPVPTLVTADLSGVEAALLAPTGAVKYKVVLPAPLYIRVMNPIKGQGGWQTTATLMQSHMVNDVLYLDGALWQRILHQAVTGSGGWQSVCRHVVCLIVAKYDIKGAEV